MFLSPNDTIAIVACSNPYTLNRKPQVDKLIEILESLNLNVIASPYIYENNSSPKDRAEILTTYFKEENIKFIFDISGGDLCNEILPFINFEEIKNTKAIYCGYSDNSVLINALFSLSSKVSLNYQLTRLLGSNKDAQLELFKSYFLFSDTLLLSPYYNFLNGNSFSGIVLGGNLRCTLKLAGTKYCPDFSNKILFLESLGGDKLKVKTYFSQYAQIGAFDNLKGIILGEFTEFEEKEDISTLLSILTPLLPNKDIPIVKTSELGHSQYSKAIYIGSNISIKK